MGVDKIVEENLHRYTGAPYALIVVQASWCGPCKVYAPNLVYAASERPSFPIGTLDVDTQLHLADTIKRVGGVPTTFFVVDGKLVGSKEGGYTGRELLAVMDAMVSHRPIPVPERVWEIYSKDTSSPLSPPR